MATFWAWAGSRENPVILEESLINPPIDKFKSPLCDFFFFFNKDESASGPLERIKAVFEISSGKKHFFDASKTALLCLASVYCFQFVRSNSVDENAPIY